MSSTAPTIGTDGPWTLGVKIGLPFAILGFLVIAAVAVALLVVAVRKRGISRSFVDTVPWSPSVTYLLSSAAAAFTLALYSALIVFVYYPLDSAYHQYRPVTGIVDKVASRLLSTTAEDGSTGTSQKFVVVFRGSPQQFGINDTRAALVKPGDRIAISCIRSFEYGSEDGYDCKWGRP